MLPIKFHHQNQSTLIKKRFFFYLLFPRCSLDIISYFSIMANFASTLSKSIRNRLLSLKNERKMKSSKTRKTSKANHTQKRKESRNTNSTISNDYEKYDSVNDHFNMHGEMKYPSASISSSALFFGVVGMAFP